MRLLAKYVARASAISFLASCAIFHGGALAQTQQSLDMTFVLGEIKVLDEHSRKRGLDEEAFAGALRLVLAANGSLRILSPRENVIGGSISGFKLDSTIQGFNGVSIWSGTIVRMQRKSGGEVEEETLQSLGPVVLADDSGLRPNALDDIAKLIRRAVQPITEFQNNLNIKVGCFKHVGMKAEAFAKTFERALVDILRKEVTFREIVHLDDCPKLTKVSSSREAVVSGRIRVLRSIGQVQPSIVLEGLTLPLPEFSSSQSASDASWGSYLTMQTRAIVTVMSHPEREDLRSLNDLRNETPRAIRAAGGKLLDENKLPCIALALLQQHPNHRDAQYLYDLGRAYNQCGSLILAGQSFKRALKLKPRWAEARREAATVLFAQENYEAAEVELREALTIREMRDARELLARTLYLLGKYEEAWIEIEGLLGSTEPKHEILITAAQIKLDQQDYRSALDFLYAARGRDGVNTRVLCEVARAIALNAAVESPADVESAKSALDLALDYEPNARDYLMRARVKLEISARANYAEGEVDAAIQDFRSAQQMAAGTTNTSEFAVVPLEVAEAQFFKGDFIAAGNEARSFLNAPLEVASGSESYRPVAYLINVASEYLTSAKEAPPEAELLANIVEFAERPRLIVNLPTGQNRVVPIRIAQWSFDSFDNYVCRKLNGNNRDVVKRLSEVTQMKLNIPGFRKGCP